ncbi:FtsH protease activity modulator HflK [Aestuariirhabdus sp. Z084]|uniref:FtsH protease activity modulator HflK n=1 Tax=Aestuariirhabdus haliotis TaxID=2918751 RepID=UPI00201B3ABC|nr:FtsH protease activity modulator HflK [Aestuariirhabdus haliotis]MCL6415639.1 FtsH protease activity modulator HflK [Aestuariirhabdus haliotis]MCL6419634.1 FtsH protease activity modulator HflK [Aestuariirhabdus haliotis]
MAWNEPGGNGKNQDPWGGGNRGGNQGPPDLDEAFRKLQEKLNGIFGGKGGGASSSSSGSSGMLIVVLLVAFAAYIWNAVYIVDQKERAVVLRFGEYLETVNPGLHIYFPPIDSKYQENVTEFRTYNLRHQMLTEDENIVEVAMSVQYNIAELKDFVLNVENPESSLEQATQSALRHVVGGSEMHSVLTEGREAMADEVRERLQSYIDNYGSGINVGKINVESTSAPREVQAAFDDVIRAREDKERSQNRAQSYANAIVPEARGEAQRMLEEAEGYRQEVIARAEGEASRFSQLLAEYTKAPEVTRQRLYLDTMQEVLGKSNKVLVDVEGGNNMMYLPLDKIMQEQTSITSGGKVELSPQQVRDLANKVAEDLRSRSNTSTRSGRNAQ